jgi:hypothetical protein
MLSREMPLKQTPEAICDSLPLRIFYCCNYLRKEWEHRPDSLAVAVEQFGHLGYQAPKGLLAEVVLYGQPGHMAE